MSDEANTEARTHDLKILPPYFEAVADGRKPFEVRINDCGYQVGDYLFLREWLPTPGEYTGRVITALVTYLSEAGMLEDCVILGIRVEKVECLTTKGDS